MLQQTSEFDLPKLRVAPALLNLQENSLFVTLIPLKVVYFDGKNLSDLRNIQFCILQINSNSTFRQNTMYFRKNLKKLGSLVFMVYVLSNLIVVYICVSVSVVCWWDGRVFIYI